MCVDSMIQSDITENITNLILNGTDNIYFTVLYSGT